MKLGFFRRWVAAVTEFLPLGPALGAVLAVGTASGAGAATVDRVTALFSSGNYNIGDVIGIRVWFSEPVSVFGAPTLILETGTTDRAAVFLSNDGPDILYFEYTVQEGDVSVDLDYVSTTALSLNGSLIRDSALANADVTLPAPGSAGSLGGSSNYVVDGVRPTVTSISLLSAGAVLNDPTVVFEVQFSEEVLGFTVEDLTLALTGSPGPSIASLQESFPGFYEVTITGLNGEGTIGLNLSSSGTGITDLAGNAISGGFTGTDTRTYDRLPPTRPIITSPTATLLPNGNVVFTGTSEPGTFTSVSLDGSAFSLVPFNASGAWTFTPASPLSDGSHTFRVISDDDATNISEVATFVFTVDSTPPPVPVFTSPAPSQVFPTPNVTLSGTAEAGAQVEVEVDAGAGFSTIGTVIASATGQWSLVTLATDGSTARARAIDGFGRASTFSAGVQIAIDSTGPVVTSVQFPVAATYGVGDAIDFTVNFDEVAVVAEVGNFARLALNIGGQTFYADYLSGSGTEELTFRHVIEAGAQDADGVTITALEANGGVIVDVAANVANLTLNGVALNVVIVDAVGPTVVLSAAGGVQTGPFPLTITFSEDIFAFTVDDLVVANATVSAFSGSGGAYQATLTPTGGDITVSLAAGAAEDGAGNPSAAATPLAVSIATALTELEANAALVLEIVTDQALQDLRSRIAASERMVKAAQDRLMAVDTVDRKLTFTGSLQADDLTLSSSGGFGGETTLANGTRRIVFGDFTVNRDAEGTVSARLDSTLAWERRLSDDALAAWFLGLEMGSADVDRGLSGPMRSLGVSLGAYGVQRLSDALYLNGFASVTAGRNDLDLSNGTLSLQSDYSTRSLQAGASLSGVMPMDGWELRPEVSLSFGRTWLGTLDLTGSAYGTTGELQLDAGQASLAALTIQPDFVLPMDGKAVADSLSLLTVAPGLTCESVSGVEDWSDCGLALGLGFQHQSQDSLLRYGADLNLVRVGPREDTSLSLTLERRF